MSAGLKRAGIAAVSIATMFCAACDNAQNQADKQVRATLAEARYLAKTEETPDGSKAKLTDAAGNSEASNAVKAQANAARAQAEMDTAIELSRQIEQKELELSRIEWGIIELAQQIRSSNSARAGYQKFDPKPIKDAIDAKIAEARGGPDKPAWFAHASSSVPTLAAVTQEVTKLEGELAQKKTEFEGLTSQRTQKIDQAEQSASQSNALKGQESLAAFTTASNLRKQAGDLTVQIDGVQSQIHRLEKQLAVAKGQQSVVNEVITQLQDQMTQVDNAWKSYEAQSLAHQQLSARILGTAVSGEQPAGAVGGTISQKSAEVERLVKLIKELRSSAEAAANNAIDFFDKAYDAASAAQIQFTTRERENPTRPEAAAWKGIAEVLNPLQYRLRQARAQRVLGELHATEAASAASLIQVRDTVRTALEGTGLSVPGALSNPELSTIRQTALTNAKAAYTQSEKLLDDLVQSGASQDLKGFAHVNRALSYYGWAQVERQAGNKADADKWIASAKASRDLAFESNVPLPSMPAELGPPPKKAEPATAPAETPAATDTPTPATGEPASPGTPATGSPITPDPATPGTPPAAPPATPAQPQPTPPVDIPVDLPVDLPTPP